MNVAIKRHTLRIFKKTQFFLDIDATYGNFLVRNNFARFKCELVLDELVLRGDPLYCFLPGSGQDHVCHQAQPYLQPGSRSFFHRMVSALLFLPQPAQPAITPQRILTQVQQQGPWLALKHRGAECLYVVVVQIHVDQWPKWGKRPVWYRNQLVTIKTKWLQFDKPNKGLWVDVWYVIRT